MTHPRFEELLHPDNDELQFVLCTRGREKVGEHTINRVIKKGEWPMDKINPLGGAIALGHPLGMSGVRIIGTAVTALEKKGGRYGLATMCVGGGQGAATIVERVSA